MAGAAVTRSLLPPISTRDPRGGKTGTSSGVANLARFDWPSLKNVLRVDPIHTLTSTLTPTLASAEVSGPPPFTVSAIFTQTRLDSWLAVGLVLATGLYLYGVHRLRVRGDHWPVSRTVLFIGPGLGSIAAVTVSG